MITKTRESINPRGACYQSAVSPDLCGKSEIWRYRCLPTFVLPLGPDFRVHALLPALETETSRSRYTATAMESPKRGHG